MNATYTIYCPPPIIHHHLIFFLFLVAQDDYKLIADLNHECDMTYAGLRKIGGNLNKQLKEMTEKRKFLYSFISKLCFN